MNLKDAQRLDDKDSNKKLVDWNKPKQEQQTEYEVLKDQGPFAG